jgi:hypothetical protein
VKRLVVHMCAYTWTALKGQVAPHAHRQQSYGGEEEVCRRTSRGVRTLVSDIHAVGVSGVTLQGPPPKVVMH